MSNSFNISLKPEIAAVVVKIDANKAVIDAVRATDVPNIQTNINANETKIDIIDTTVDAIRAVDIPVIASEINDNEAKIDTSISDIATVDGIVDAIKLKTDLLPLTLRGTMTQSYLSMSSDTFADVVNITDSGILMYLNIGADAAGAAIEIILSVDGITYATFSHITSEGNENQGLSPKPVASTSPYITLIDTVSFSFDIEFSTSLRVQLRRSDGSGNVHCSCSYSLD